MSIRTDTISGIEAGQAFSFEVNNKRSTNSGDLFMSDAEYAAHKAEQESNMRAAIQAKLSAQTKDTELDTLRVKISGRTATVTDLSRYIELKEGL